MQCAPKLWTHRPVVPRGTSQADDPRGNRLAESGAVLLPVRGEP